MIKKPGNNSTNNNNSNSESTTSKQSTSSGNKNYYSCPVFTSIKTWDDEILNVSLNKICWCRGKTSLMNQAWWSRTVNLTVDVASMEEEDIKQQISFKSSNAFLCRIWKQNDIFIFFRQAQSCSFHRTSSLTLFCPHKHESCRNVLTKCVRRRTEQSSTIFISLTSSLQKKIMFVYVTQKRVHWTQVFFYLWVCLSERGRGRERERVSKCVWRVRGLKLFLLFARLRLSHMTWA